MLISGSLSTFFFSLFLFCVSLLLIRYPFNNFQPRVLSVNEPPPCAHTRLRLPLWINYGGRSKEHATTKPIMQRVVRIQKAWLVFGFGRGLESEICISSRTFYPRKFLFSLSFLSPLSLPIPSSTVLSSVKIKRSLDSLNVIPWFPDSAKITEIVDGTFKILLFSENVIERIYIILEIRVSTKKYCNILGNIAT